MRRARLANQKKRKSILFILIPTFLIVVILLVFVFVIFKINSLPKFIYVEKTIDGGGEVVIVDSKADKIIKYKINPEAVLNSARGLGEYKLESLWILGDKEGLKGKLVAESVTTNYLAPVYYWKNGNKTNLNLYQKIKLNLLKIDSADNVGVWNSFDLSNSVLINFIAESIQEQNISVEVEDLTGSPDTINKVSSIVGTLGSKVSGYNKGYDENFDCSVDAGDYQTALIFSKAFGCEITSNTKSEVVRIKLGAKFADRF